MQAGWNYCLLLRSNDIFNWLTSYLHRSIEIAEIRTALEARQEIICLQKIFNGGKKCYSFHKRLQF